MLFTVWMFVNRDYYYYYYYRNYYYHTQHISIFAIMHTTLLSTLTLTVNNRDWASAITASTQLSVCLCWHLNTNICNVFVVTLSLEVKVNVDLYIALSWTHLYGTHSEGISQFYLHTPHSASNRMNHTCLCLPNRSWYLERCRDISQSRCPHHSNIILRLSACYD